MSMNESADIFCPCFLCTHARVCLSIPDYTIDFLKREEPRYTFNRLNDGWEVEKK